MGAKLLIGLIILISIINVKPMFGIDYYLYVDDSDDWADYNQSPSTDLHHSILLDESNLVSVESFLRELGYGYASLLMLDLVTKIRKIKHQDQNNVADVETALLDFGMPYKQALLIGFRNKQRLFNQYIID